MSCFWCAISFYCRVFRPLAPSDVSCFLVLGAGLSHLCRVFAEQQVNMSLFSGVIRTALQLVLPGRGAQLRVEGVLLGAPEVSAWTMSHGQVVAPLLESGGDARPLEAHLDRTHRELARERLRSAQRQVRPGLGRLAGAGMRTMQFARGFTRVPASGARRLKASPVCLRFAHPRSRLAANACRPATVLRTDMFR